MRNAYKRAQAIMQSFWLKSKTAAAYTVTPKNFDHVLPAPVVKKPATVVRCRLSDRNTTENRILRIFAAFDAGFTQSLKTADPSRDKLGFDTVEQARSAFDVFGKNCTFVMNRFPTVPQLQTWLTT